MGSKQSQQTVPTPLDPAKKSEIKPLEEKFTTLKGRVDKLEATTENNIEYTRQEKQKLSELKHQVHPTWEEVENKPSFGGAAFKGEKDFLPSDITINKKPLIADFFLTKKDIELENVPNIDATDPKNINQSPLFRFFTDDEREKLKKLETPQPVQYEKIEGKPEFASIAFSGDYNDLKNSPVIASAAEYEHYAFATADQGKKAETALQPGGDGGKLLGMSKSQVGLSNVDNTPDAEKPISQEVSKVLGEFSQALVRLNSDLSNLMSGINAVLQINYSDPNNIKQDDAHNFVTKGERDIWNNTQALKFGSPNLNQVAQMSSLKTRLISVGGETIRVLTLD